MPRNVDAKERFSLMFDGFPGQFLITIFRLRSQDNHVCPKQDFPFGLWVSKI